MWICRAGKDACYIDYVKDNNRIYLFWDGYKNDYSNIDKLQSFREIVNEERPQESKTAISNWAAQIHAFCRAIQVNDLILIPDYKAQNYMLVNVVGNYSYNENNKFPHSREIEVIKEKIPKKIFPQNIIYSLNAYRTIYRVKDEDQILKIIEMNLEV